MLKRLSFAILFLTVLVHQVPAQLTISPYSRYGVGEIQTSSSIRNTTMGGLGIGISDWGTINRFNPASYTELRLSTAELSAFGTFRNQKDATSSYNSFSGGYQNVAFGFPSNKSFALVMGLAPYSSSEYDLVVRDTLNVAGTDEPLLHIYNASGGLNQLYVGGAFKVFNKVSIGANVAWTFGSIDKTWITAFEKSDFRPVSTNKDADVSGIRVVGGVQYADKLYLQRKVDQTKHYSKLIENLEEEKAELAKTSTHIEKQKVKLDQQRISSLRKREVYEAERARTTALVKSLQEAGASEGAINRAEAEDRRYSRKIKKIDLDYNQNQRKIQNEERLLSRRLAGYDKFIGKYHQKLEEISKNPDKQFEAQTDSSITFRFGAIVEPGSGLKGDYHLRYTNYNGVDGVTDTLWAEKGAIKLPLKYGFGFSIGHPGVWTAGVDFTMQNWSKFAFFSDANNLGSSMKLNVGGEWIPDRFSNKFHRRIAWRAGAYYENTGLAINGIALNETGITFGVGLPMRIADIESKVFSRINLGLSYALRGTTSSGLLRENMIKVSLGVNLNERMFITRKVN
ncbi:MAG: hypothetical protein H6581_20405 [Bacteroidia bacterium]|nr:hypothetical protein [Bacteroidia bacterium]